MLTATALVLFMTIPGLALFYGGMVRSKNILSVMMQCFAVTGLMSILWMVYGYSLAFDTTGMEAGVTNFNSFVGGLDRAFLSGLTPDSLVGAFPESVFITFQMTFAIITPALIVGAFAERMKFSAMLVFMGVWFTLVYAPIAHMVWGGDGGLMWDWGVLDFAGGTVVHINAGIAGLVACLVLGKRKGYPTTPMAPHNLGLTLVGAAMLWVGWFDSMRARPSPPTVRPGWPCWSRRSQLPPRRWAGCSPSGSATANPAHWASPRAWLPAWSLSPRPPAPSARWAR